MSDLWEKKNPPSAANQACAHLHVEYFTRLRDDGSTDGWWACRDCGTNFIPIAYARQQVEAFREKALVTVVLYTLEKMLGRSGQALADISSEITAAIRRLKEIPSV